MKLQTVILIVVVILMIIALYFGNNDIEVSEYDVDSEKLPDEFEGYKILQLSDLHSKDYGAKNRKIVSAVKKTEPDIIVLTGDMVNCYDDNFHTFIELIKSLSDYRLYFIAGNNEIKMDDYKRDELYKEMEANGVIIIDNSKVEIVRGKNSINLYGLWFDLIYYKEIHSGYNKDTVYAKSNMERVIGKCNEDKFNILLTHNPLYFDVYAEWGADLTLSGHVHGGIVRLPVLGGVLSPERKFFPKYSGGRYEVSGKTMVVNRGLGGKPLLPRVFNRPEITLIKLHSK